MINKTLVILLSALIVLVSLYIGLNVSIEPETQPTIEGNTPPTTDDVIDEINQMLLDEDTDIKIGEMI